MIILNCFYTNNEFVYFIILSEMNIIYRFQVNTVEADLGSSREGSRTDSEVVDREEQAIKLDGLSVAEMKELREKAEKHHFQVNEILIWQTVNQDKV